MKIRIIHGPNLNLVGIREPEIYGTESFEEFLTLLKKEFSDCSVSLFQSNHEGELIDQIQQLNKKADAFILNAGGLTHSSVSLGDAVAACPIPFVEVHLSNIFAREPFRHTSFTAPHALAVLSGMGMEGYRFALQFLKNKLGAK